MGRLWHILILALKRNGFSRAEYIRKNQIFKKIGKNCYYHPLIIPAESDLISMGDNVVVATGVQLITHDMTYTLFGNDEGLEERIGKGKYPYYTASIHIGNNVMIGANSLIMPGVNIGNNVVIGGGTVVTKDIPDGVIVGGVPAKRIGDYWDLAMKRKKEMKE